jgi:SAM-dependent methyltransferase
MSVDFAGETAQLYAGYRRDLPADQAAELAGELGLTPDDVVVDVGCGTGQLAVPLRDHCAVVLAVDPEPLMLAGLRDRGTPGVLCLLGGDTDLPELARLHPGQAGAGAVVIGNALHWMDEPATLRASAALLRPGGGIGVVTQGPPLWLGGARWQRRVREVLEQRLGPTTDSCGSDAAALSARVRLLEDLGLVVRVASWRASHDVDAEWVVGHLGSALPSGALERGRPGGLADALHEALASESGSVFVEEVVTTAVIARRAT